MEERRLLAKLYFLSGELTFSSDQGEAPPCPLEQNLHHPYIANERDPPPGLEEVGNDGTLRQLSEQKGRDAIQKAILKKPPSKRV